MLTKAQQEVLDIVRNSPDGIAAPSLAIQRYEQKKSSEQRPFYKLPQTKTKPMVRGAERTLKALWLKGYIEPFGVGYDGTKYRVIEQKKTGE